MVEFGTGGYMHPMDRSYGDSSPVDNTTSDVGIGIKDIGFSTGLGPTPNINAVSAKMRTGQKKMELTFMGAGKGNQQGQTPGMFGKRQRQALREMQTANKFDFTTHSSVGVMGLAGMDQQGNFSRQNKERAVNEIKRAVDFAADVSRGGPVVVHSGEFFRHMTDANWNQQGDWQNKFQMFKGEDERAAYRVVDARTGSVIQEARKNRKVSRPVWNLAEKGTEYEDFDGSKKTATGQEKLNIYVDYYGKRIQPENRVPKFDKETGNFIVRQLDWNDLKQEAQEMTYRAREVWKDWRKGKIDKKQFEESYWIRFKDAKSEDDIQVQPEEAYIISTLETNAANSRGWAHYYGGSFDEHVDNMKKLKKALAFYEKIEETMDPEEKEQLKQEARTLNLPPGLVPEESKYPSEHIKRAIRTEDRQMKQSQEASASQWAQAAESTETIRHVESAESYALKESYDAYATAAINAMHASNKLKDKGAMKRPLALAVENLFPENYGGHPDELINLITNSRARMAEILTQQGMDKRKAEQEAKEHIYATFDTAHFNMWWKYWQGDQSKSIEDNRQDFDKWYLHQVEKMAKSGIVGHLHLVDNYGYEDEHLAPGEGNVPINKALKIFKKHGFNGDIVVEPGADFSTDSSGTQTLLKAWRHFGSPVYGTATGMSTARGWGEVGYGYFGQNQPPYFVFGGYSPSEDWTLWSGVPLE